MDGDIEDENPARNGDDDVHLAMADDDDGDDQGENDERGENADGDHSACVHLPVLLPVKRSAAFHVPEHLSCLYSPCSNHVIMEQ